jgi:hypothetical protein
MKMQVYIKERIKILIKEFFNQKTLILCTVSAIASSIEVAAS